MLNSYIVIRRSVRRAVKAWPALDRKFGLQLVRLDRAMRRMGALGSGPPNPVSFHGMSVEYGPADRTLAEAIVTNDTYEEETIQVIRDVLDVGGRFVDVGANIGLLALVAAEVVGPSGEVIAFEPSPQTCRFLVKNLEQNGFADWTTANQVAVTDTAGTARFVVTTKSEFNAIDWGAGSDSTIIEVGTTSLDRYFHDAGWPDVDLIKLDIEGHEIPAVRGMRRLVARNPKVALIVEYHLGVLERAGVSGSEFVSALTEVGFSTFTALVAETPQLTLPADLPILDRLARRQNVNLLCRV